VTGEVQCACMCWSGRSGSSQYSADSRANVWSGELSKNVAGFGYSEKQVTISVDSAGSAGGSRAEVKPVKEVPLWMSRSTVDSAEDSDRPLQQTQVSVCLSVCLSVSVSLAVVCLSVCLSVACLSVCLCLLA